MGHPEHGELFDAAWSEVRDPLAEGPGLDLSFAPSGRPALALCAVLLNVTRGLLLDQAPEDHPVAIWQLVKHLEAYPDATFERIDIRDVIARRRTAPAPDLDC